MEAINNGELDLSLDNFGFNNCERTGDFLDNYYYCKINGKRLKQPSESISYQGLFKKWNKVELILNYSRLFITAIFIVFFYFALYKKVKDEENNLFSYSIAFLAVLVADSAICILIRSFVILLQNL